MERLIYGLRDPLTREIRYVGSSRRGLARPRVHAGLARRGERGHKANWIRSLLSAGLSYEIVVLENNPPDLDAAECYWISVGRAALGLRFTNLCDGGQGVANPSEDSRRTRREKLLGHSVSPETRKKISVGREGFRHTYEARAKISASLKGRKHSAATRQKIAEAHRGRKRAEFSSDHKAKILASLDRAREASRLPQALAKRSKALKGRVFSSEVKARMLAAQRARRARERAAKHGRQAADV